MDYTTDDLDALSSKMQQLMTDLRAEIDTSRHDMQIVADDEAVIEMFDEDIDLYATVFVRRDGDAIEVDAYNEDATNIRIEAERLSGDFRDHQSAAFFIKHMAA